MGTIKQGVLGPFSGKVGTVIGSVWKGIAVMRGIAPSVTDAKSEAQLAHRAKFKLIVSFLHSMTAFLRVSFKSQAVKMSEFNAAFSRNIRQAVTGAYPAFTVDYTRALVSCGSLPGVVNGAAASVLAGKVDFTWDDNSSDAGAMADDKVLLLVYNPLRNQSVSLSGGKTRAEGADSLIVPDLFTGETVECYLAFVKANGGETSNSQWVGSVEVA